MKVKILMVALVATIALAIATAAWAEDATKSCPQGKKYDDNLSKCVPDTTAP